jgi:hypothetical protein
MHFNLIFGINQVSSHWVGKFLTACVFPTSILRTAPTTQMLTSKVTLIQTQTRGLNQSYLRNRISRVSSLTTRFLPYPPVSGTFRRLVLPRRLSRNRPNSLLERLLLILLGHGRRCLAAVAYIARLPSFAIPLPS